MIDREAGMLLNREPQSVDGAGGTIADLPSWAEARAAALRTERRDAAENRRRILAAARALFAARGVDAVTMQEIARATGVGQGTLYRRYGHKGALCEALLEDSLYDLYQEVAARIEADGGTGSPLAQLERLIDRLIAFNEENAALLSVACGERRGEWYHCPTYVWLHRTIVAFLRRATDAGEAPPLDAESVGDTLLAALDIELYRFQRHARGFTPERIAAGIRPIVSGLRTAAALLP